jgi:hypothetical protein
MNSPVSLSRKILSLRFSGYEVEDISAILDLSVDRIQREITRAAASSADEARAALVREAELLKLEELDAVYLPAALEGSLKSAHYVLECMKRRAALIGADKQPATINQFNLVQILASMPKPEPIVSNPIIEAVAN